MKDKKTFFNNILENKKNLIILGVIGVIITTFSIYSHTSKINNKPFSYDKECINYETPAELIQPKETRGDINRVPISYWSYIREQNKLLSEKKFWQTQVEDPVTHKKIKKKELICNILMLSTKDNFLNLSSKKLSQKNLLKEINKKLNELEKGREEYKKLLKDIEKRSGVELTAFERELVSEIYLINKFGLKAVAKGVYGYTDIKTPEKLNFFFKETGVKYGLEFIELYFKKDGNHTLMNVNDVIEYNTSYPNINPSYVFKFANYDKYIYADTIDKNQEKMQRENQRIAEELKRKAEETQKKEQQQQQQIPRERIVDSVEIQEGNIPVEIITTGETEQPLPEPPAPYVPKKIKKPNQRNDETENQNKD